MKGQKLFIKLGLAFGIFSSGFAFNVLNASAELQEVFDLVSGTKSYYSKNYGYNGVTGVNYSYSIYHSVTADSNTATTAKFNSVTINAGDTNPENSGAYGMFRVVDISKSYITNKFYALPVDGGVRTDYPAFTAIPSSLYTDLDVFASSSGVSATLAALHRDKIAFNK